MRYIRFSILAVVLFLIADTGSDVFNRVYILDETPRFALFDHVHWASVEIIGTLFLLTPFLVVGLVAAWLEVRVSSLRTWAIFGIANLFLLYQYFVAYESAARASLAKHWTAAALSIGFLPLLAIPFAIIVALVGFGIASLSGGPKDGS